MENNSFFREVFLFLMNLIKGFVVSVGLVLIFFGMSYAVALGLSDSANIFSERSQTINLLFIQNLYLILGTTYVIYLLFWGLISCFNVFHKSCRYQIL